MTARIIDGKAVTAALREQVAAEALRLKNDHASRRASRWCWSEPIPRAMA